MTEHANRVERDKVANNKEKEHDNPGINSKLKPGDEDANLDKSLMDSFPTSDPSSATQPTKNGPAGDPRTKP